MSPRAFQPLGVVGVVNAVGVTAGASAPEVLVQQVIARLKELGGNQVVENPGEEENIVFAVPVELR